METKKSVWVGLGSLNRGFTIVEVTIVIVVIGILISIAVSSGVGYQASARDRERINDIDAISQSLERYYRTQSAVTGASYPASNATIASIATIVGDNDLVTAPRQTANSIVMVTAAGAQSPTINQYMYQALNVNGTVCSSAPCVRYRMYYRLESNPDIQTKDSLRQQ